MTGYGRAEMVSEAGRIVVEIRSVNHRYGEITVKLPRIWLASENEVRKSIAGRLKRGKIDAYVQLQGAGGEGSQPTVNLPLARSYAGIFSQLNRDLGLEDKVPLALIIAQKDVIVTGETVASGDAVPDELLAAVATAVDNLDRMRLKEGEALLTDIRLRRERLATLIALIGERAPRAVAENVARLRERVAQLLREGGVDEARLAQEIALMADRADITEELVRFDSHFRQFDEALHLGEGIGRKLDFILQELNREVNTIGSKANDGEITAAVVELKAELEKIREQIQNVE
jgi:uncharacterized protein (TIGR00255 family)